MDARGAVAESVNPATDEVLGTYHDGDLGVAQAAIAAASKAFAAKTWSKDRALRAKVLWEMADPIERHFGELVEALTLENGKLQGEAGFEMSPCAPKLRYYSVLALTDSGSASVNDAGGAAAEAGLARTRR